ncbi:hypothetical protein LZ30DRAFT_683930 [Colletotrichum cereale]|nr:hypothetical protein LZ30DRAFT_683930 [Colletotrichum cereale]
MTPATRSYRVPLRVQKIGARIVFFSTSVGFIPTPLRTIVAVKEEVYRTGRIDIRPLHRLIMKLARREDITASMQETGAYRSTSSYPYHEVAFTEQPRTYGVGGC